MFIEVKIGIGVFSDILRQPDRRNVPARRLHLDVHIHIVRDKRRGAAQAAVRLVCRYYGHRDDRHSADVSGCASRSTCQIRLGTDRARQGAARIAELRIEWCGYHPASTDRTADARCELDRS